MRQSTFGQKLAIFFVVVGIVGFIDIIGEMNGPKCVRSGCDNNQSPGSSYCYLHKPFRGQSYDSTGSFKSNAGNTSSDTNHSAGTSSYSNGAKKKTTTKRNAYESYDDGYDDIYMDGDYDYDRYDYDSDYADGVDDAMDEFEEDW